MADIVDDLTPEEVDILTEVLDFSREEKERITEWRKKYTEGEREELIEDEEVKYAVRMINIDNKIEEMENALYEQQKNLEINIDPIEEPGLSRSIEKITDGRLSDKIDYNAYDTAYNILKLSAESLFGRHPEEFLHADYGPHGAIFPKLNFDCPKSASDYASLKKQNITKKSETTSMDAIKDQMETASMMDEGYRVFKLILIYIVKWLKKILAKLLAKLIKKALASVSGLAALIPNRYVKKLIKPVLGWIFDPIIKALKEWIYRHAPEELEEYHTGDYEGDTYEEPEINDPELGRPNMCCDSYFSVPTDMTTAATDVVNKTRRWANRVKSDSKYNGFKNPDVNPKSFQYRDNLEKFKEMHNGIKSIHLSKNKSEKVKKLNRKLVDKAKQDPDQKNKYWRIEDWHVSE